MDIDKVFDVYGHNIIVFALLIFHENREKNENKNKQKSNETSKHIHISNSQHFVLCFSTENNSLSDATIATHLHDISNEANFGCHWHFFFMLMMIQRRNNHNVRF